MDKETIFTSSSQVKASYVSPPKASLVPPEKIIAAEFLRDELPLPNAGELEVVRHYARLGDLNFSVDANFYPLGSCTMKYNPKINEAMARLEGFTGIHPYQNSEDLQGVLELIYRLGKVLCIITGMKRFSLQPSSGAQGELTGMLMIRKFHQLRGEKRTKVVIPDSAHGTNPATAAMCGYRVEIAESNSRGLIDIEKLRHIVDRETAAVMLTNPNTLGLFEENISEISDIVHAQGGFLYYDGANFNPLLGITNPALMGFDVVHLNLHKTFSTPHGCGGPGAGVVGAGETLAEFLPLPLVEEKDGKFYFDYRPKHSIGRIRTFYGNFSVLVKAYAYLLRLGRDGLLNAAQNAVLNANYIRAGLEKEFEPAYPGRCMHEVVFTCQRQKEKGAAALDIAKRLIDFKIHPPTMYFPLIVKEALMVEPTETESRRTLDYFIQAMRKINQEIDSDLEKVKTAPHTAPVKRVDEVKAARSLKLRWQEPGV